MNSFVYYLLLGVSAYVLGSIPVAYIIGRAVKSLDVRSVGEGNVGARNVFHTVGHRWGSLVFLLDFSKGAVIAALVSNQNSARVAFAGFFLLLGHGFLMAEIHRWERPLFGRRVYSSSTSLFRFDCGSCFRTSLAKTRKFMPTTVTVVLLSIVLLRYLDISFSEYLSQSDISSRRSQTKS